MASTLFSVGRTKVVGFVVSAMIGVAALMGAMLCASDLQPDDTDGVPIDESADDEQAGAASVPLEEDPSPTPTYSDSGGVGDVVGRQLDTLSRDQGSEVREERYPEEADVAARTVLGRYEADGTCLLASAGYLDLFGRVWGCVVEGPGWVDVCVVEETAEGTSVVRTVRMLAA